MPPIHYHIGNDLNLDEVIALYRVSTLGERRPVDDRDAMKAMLQHANLIVTAWNDSLLVGIARTLTDFSYVGYLSDLAVHAEYQHAGIGRELIRRTRGQMKPQARIVLLAAPAAIEYYPHIGFTRHSSAWILRGTDPFPESAPDHGV